jgi:hypothetical protein
MITQKETKEAMTAVKIWSWERQVHLTQGDMLIIKNHYLPIEIERYRRSNVAKPNAYAGVFALIEFCRDYGMKDCIPRLRIRDLPKH